MILWLTGNTGAGKTELANFLKDIIPNAILVDGDSVRSATVNFDMSEESRVRNNLEIARWLSILDNDPHTFIVSVICPYKDLRRRVHEICNCYFIYVEGGKDGEEFPYEIPDSSEEYIKYRINWRI